MTAVNRTIFLLFLLGTQLVSTANAENRCQAAFNGRMQASRVQRAIGTFAWSTAFLLAPASPLFSLALAGGSISGGGFGYRRGNKLILLDLDYHKHDGIRAKSTHLERKPELSDLIPKSLTDDQLLNGWSIQLKDFAPDALALAQERLELWRSSSPAMIEKIREVLKSNIWHATLLEPAWIPETYDRVNDLTLRYRYDSQKLVQVAVNNSARGIYLNPRLWSQLDLESRAGLLIHESYRLLHALTDERPFDDMHRSVTGLLMLKNPDGVDPFATYYNDLQMRSVDPSKPSAFFSSHRHVEEYRHEEFEMSVQHPAVRNKDRLANEFRSALLDQKKIGSAKADSLAIVRGLYDSTNARDWIAKDENERWFLDQSMVSASTLNEVPASVLGFVFKKVIMIDLVWRGRAAKLAPEDSLVFKLGNTPTLLNQEMVNELIVRFEKAGNLFEKTQDRKTGEEFFTMAHLLREMTEKLYSNPDVFRRLFKNPAADLESLKKIPEMYRDRILKLTDLYKI